LRRGHWPVDAAGNEVDHGNIVVKAAKDMVSGIDPARLFEAALRKVDLLVRDEAFITACCPDTESAVRQAVLAVWAP
jgi:hypothetical protein